MVEIVNQWTWQFRMRIRLAGCVAACLLLAGAGCRKPDPTMAKFDDLKAKIQSEAETVQLMKVAGTVREGDAGYLVSVSDEKTILPLAQRRTMQQENVWREEIFGIIGGLAGHSKEEVAKTFAQLARRQNPDAAPAP